MSAREYPSYKPNDTPVSNVHEDCLNVKKRIVDRIFEFLISSPISTLTLAITGEWGSGKTSVMNLLAQEIESCKVQSQQNIVIRFEPLLEGKFEVADIMELFYFKLYAAIQTKTEGAWPFFKKLLSSLGAIALTGTKVTAAMSYGLGQVEGEFDLEKKYEALRKIWENNDIQSFAQQTAELNSFFQERKLKVYVFIDEIDRLPATHVINFLMFARVLECFDNLICIVGIDYAQVIESLKSERIYSLSSYDRVKGYLDKLFHARFHVHHNESDLISFAIKGFKSIDEKAFDLIIDTDEYKIKNKIGLIIDYLKTPRQVKKWLTLIFINKILVEYYPGELLNFLSLMAVCVKHPIVLNYLAEHTLPMLNSIPFLSLHVKDKYGSDLLHRDIETKKIAEGILHQSTGILKEEKEHIHLKIIENPIIDSRGRNFLWGVLNYPKISLLSLFVDGYLDENKVKVYFNYFEADTDEAIRWLIDNEDSAIISDLDRDLLNQYGRPKKAADINLLNILWVKKINSISIDNLYLRIILFSLNKHELGYVLATANLSLTESYINNILGIFKIHNKAGYYLISITCPPERFDVEKRGLHELKFKEKNIYQFDENVIKDILKLWVSRVENELEKNLSSLLEIESHLVSIFYRYVQWAFSIDGFDKRDKLADYLTVFISERNIELEKKRKLIEDITKVCSGYKKMENDNPLESLFNANDSLISAINELTNNISDIKSYSDFQRCVEDINQTKV